MSSTERDEHAGEVLDQAAFEDAAGGDRELMVELADLYVSDTEARLPQMEAAVVAGDLELLGRLAHGAKGASASIGAVQTAEAFKRLEHLGRSGVSEGLEEALAAAAKLYHRTKRRLRRLAA